MHHHVGLLDLLIQHAIICCHSLESIVTNYWSTATVAWSLAAPVGTYMWGKSEGKATKSLEGLLDLIGKLREAACDFWNIRAKTDNDERINECQKIQRIVNEINQKITDFHKSSRFFDADKHEARSLLREVRQLITSEDFSSPQRLGNPEKSNSIDQKLLVLKSVLEASVSMFPRRLFKNRREV